MRRQLKIGFLLGILLSFYSTSLLYALKVPPRPDGYVTDKAGVLSVQAREKLEAFLHDFENKTSNQVIVVTFPSLEGESLEDFSMRLGEIWKVGQKGRDNGVMLLVFKNDRKMRIEVGYGLEGVLPDALAGRILNEVAVPYFKKGDYENGILEGVTAICQATQGEFKGLARSRGGEGSSGALLFFIFLFAIAVSIADLVRYTLYTWQHHEYPYRFQFLEWWVRFAILFFLLRIFFQILMEVRVSSRGGFYGGGSGGYSGGGGGFSGGGGSFGGGGASGSW